MAYLLHILLFERKYCIQTVSLNLCLGLTCAGDWPVRLTGMNLEMDRSVRGLVDLQLLMTGDWPVLGTDMNWGLVCTGDWNILGIFSPF